MNEEFIKSKKLSKWIRYPLLVVIALIYLFVISLFFLIAYLLRDQLLVSLGFAGIGILFLMLTIFKFKNEYLDKKSESVIDDILK